jgi:hypothetical protein
MMRRLLSVAALVLLAAVSASAQAVKGSLVGTSSTVRVARCPASA